MCPPSTFNWIPARLLRGRVTDEAGNPVANAFVETTRRGVDKIRWSTNTDANGRFEWDSAPKEPLLYSVLANGFNHAYAKMLQADGSEQEIKLTSHQPEKDTIQITGTAVDADTGLPLDGFKVMVGELDPEWAFPLKFYADGQSGKFALSLPSQSNHSSYQIQIEKDGYLPGASAEMQRTNGTQTLEFALHKGAGPAGVVLQPGGEPGGQRDGAPLHTAGGRNTGRAGAGSKGGEYDDLRDENRWRWKVFAGRSEPAAGRHHRA